jgi:precorrin-2/cobalt-factor-2 C20-methyltransferase
VNTLNNTKGTLFGIGVGPGDPDLIPVKSINILKNVDIIFAASSTKNSHSQAINIAKKHLPGKIPIQILPFPMTKNEEVSKKAWKKNASLIIKSLDSGKDAAFLTLGDPLTYSTYGYILKYIKKLSPDLKIKTIPGITSYQAAAASTNTPLMKGEESLLILSGVDGGNNLRKSKIKPDNIVFMKAYKNAPDIVAAIKEAKMDSLSYGVINCGLSNQEIVPDITEFLDKKPGYWTLIVAKKEK